MRIGMSPTSMKLAKRMSAVVSAEEVESQRQRSERDKNNSIRQLKSERYHVVYFDRTSLCVQAKHIIHIGIGRNRPKNGLGTHLGGGNSQLLCLELMSTCANQVGNRSGVLRPNVHGFVVHIVRSAPNRAGQRVGIALGRGPAAITYILCAELIRFPRNTR